MDQEVAVEAVVVTEAAKDMEVVLVEEVEGL